MDQATREQFESLICQLSPENLSCDGELSRSQIDRRLASIRRQWRELERKVGRKVSQNEIEDQLYSRFHRG